MSVLRIGAAITGAFVILFMWSAASQLLPWGHKSARQFISMDEEPYVFGQDNVVSGAPGTWVTSRFDQDFTNGISTLATDQSFSWIVSIPAAEYSPMRYLSVEALTQLATALLLVSFLVILRRQRLLVTLLVVAGFSFAAGLATHGQMMNWWGVPSAYGIGMMFNLCVGWLLAATAAGWILREGKL